MKVPSWTEESNAFFTTFGANTPITSDLIREKVTAAREDGCDVLMCFVQDEGRALWHSDLVPPSRLDPGFDVVEALVEETHRQGLRFVAQWMGVHVQTLQMTEHPAWRQRDASGNAAAAMCLNSPFGSYLIEQIREVLSAYPVDGVYLDGVYARQGGCYCDACSLQFREMTGHSLVSAAGSEEGRDDHWLQLAQAGIENPDLRRFRFDTVSGWMTRLRDTVDTHSPDVKVILDVLGMNAGFVPNGQDVARLSPIVDVFALECYWEQLREPVDRVQFEVDVLRAEAGRPVWLLRWISRDPDGDHVSVPAATVESFGGVCALGDARPVVVEMNLYSVDQGLRATVEGTLERLDKLKLARAGLAPLDNTALILPEQAKSLDTPDDQIGEHHRALEGSWSALTHAHVPVHLVSEDDLVDQAPRFSALVLPSATRPSEELAKQILLHVHNGGGAVLSYRALLESPALADELGLEFNGVQVRRGAIGTEALGGSELVTYGRFGDDHPVVNDVADQLFSFTGPYAVLSDGSTLGSILDPHLGAMQADRWFSWYPGREASGLGVAMEVGKGRIVYLAVPFDVIYHDHGWPEMGSVLASAARWAAGSYGPRIQAPSTVAASVRTANDGRRTLITMANRTTNQLYSIGPTAAVAGSAASSSASAASGAATSRRRFVSEIVPVAGVEIQVQIPEEADPTVTSILGADLEVRREGTEITIKLDCLEAIEAVMVET